MSLFTSLAKKMWATAPRRTVSVSLLSTLTAFLATTIYTELFRNAERKAVFEENLLNQPFFRKHIGANFEEKLGVNFAMFFVLTAMIWGGGEFAYVKWQAYQEERRKLQIERRQSETLQSAFLPKRPEIPIEAQNRAKSHYDAIMVVLAEMPNFLNEGFPAHFMEVHWRTVFWPAWQFLRQMPSDAPISGNFKKLQNKLNERKLRAYCEKMQQSGYHKKIMPQEDLAFAIRDTMIDFRAKLHEEDICSKNADLSTIADSLSTLLKAEDLESKFKVFHVWQADHLKRLYTYYYLQWDGLLNQSRISGEWIPELCTQHTMLQETIEKLKPFIDSVSQLSMAFYLPKSTSSTVKEQAPEQPPELFRPLSPADGAGVFSRKGSEEEAEEESRKEHDNEPLLPSDVRSGSEEPANRPQRQATSRF